MDILQFMEAFILSFALFGSITIGVGYLLARVIFNFEYDKKRNKRFENI